MKDIQKALGQRLRTLRKAKGLTQWLVITRHVVKNAMTPVITLLGMTAARLISGSIFIETIFNLPGIGSIGNSSLRMGDIQTGAGVLIVTATMVMFSNLLVDLVYGLLDPRVRLAK